VSVIVFSGFLLLVLCFIAVHARQERILSGTPSTYSAAVIVNSDNEDHCSGTLLCNNVFLSAKHCGNVTSICVADDIAKCNGDNTYTVETTSTLVLGQLGERRAIEDGILIGKLNKAVTQKIQFPELGKDFDFGPKNEGLKGKQFTIVGFGISDYLHPKDGPYGIKRQATVTLYKYKNNIAYLCPLPHENQAGYKGDSGGTVLAPWKDKDALDANYLVGTIFATDVDNRYFILTMTFDITKTKEKEQYQFISAFMKKYCPKSNSTDSSSSSYSGSDFASGSSSNSNSNNDASVSSDIVDDVYSGSDFASGSSSNSDSNNDASVSSDIDNVYSGSDFASGSSSNSDSNNDASVSSDIDNVYSGSDFASGSSSNSDSNSDASVSSSIPSYSDFDSNTGSD